MGLRKLLGYLDVTRQGWATVRIYAARGISLFLPQGPQVVERRTGAHSLEGARKVAIFLHYDRRGIVHDYVLHYLMALRRIGFEILFVSNAPPLAETEWNKVAPHAALMLRRRNRGHDFGAFRDAVAELSERIATLDRLIIANDSVYGPLQDLSPLLARCDADDGSVWSITDSWDRRYHLQSYFLLFKREALIHPAFLAFWRSVRLVPSRSWVVRKYEIGLTQAMVKAGLRCAALFPYRAAAAALSGAVRHQGLLERKDLSDYHRDYANRLFAAVERGDTLNQTHYFWDYLIGEAGCPFIKRDLLLRNPVGVPYVNQWDALIRRSSQYDPDLILRHLELIARGRVV
jgi:lipopolysaccharide biosynthesis protein